MEHSSESEKVPEKVGQIDHDDEDLPSSIPTVTIQATSEDDPNEIEQNANNEVAEGGGDNKEEKDNFGDLKRVKRFNWSPIAFRAAVCAATYPIECARTLMQIGYEPFPPVNSISIIGRPCLLFMNNFKYIKYIQSVDGLAGVYRGLLPRLLHQTLYYVSYGLFNNTLKMLFPPSTGTLVISKGLDGRFRLRFHPSPSASNQETKELVLTPSSDHDTTLESDLDDDDLELELEETDGESVRQDDSDSDEEQSDLPPLMIYIKGILRDLTSRLSAIVISYPLQLITVRTIAEFVGREKIYSQGIWAGIGQVYKESGLGGFYRGLVPRMCGETVQVCLVGLSSYVIKSQICNEEGRSVLNISMSVLISAFTYPFYVVSNTMAVAGAPTLKLANSPFFVNWLDCWKYLGGLNQLRRGSSYFLRYYSGPSIRRGDVLIPTGPIQFGPAHFPTRGRDYL